MRKYFFVAIMALVTTMWCSCDDVETYAEKKEKERAYINDFILEEGITVISKEEFEKDTITDITKNEFVLFKDKGIYMQIVRRGEGRMIEDGDNITYMARYMEKNIETGDTISGNLYANSPDFFVCSRSGDSFSAKFTQGYMMTIYSNSAVPKGWMVPLSYVTPGRPNDKGAKVRLILPHGEATSVAAQYVYPTYYEINYIPEE